MNETVHMHPEDLLNMLKRAERLGAYKTLNWLCWEFTENDNITVKDIVKLVHGGIGSIGGQLYTDFKEEQLIDLSLKEIIEKRKQKGVERK